MCRGMCNCSGAPADVQATTHLAVCSEGMRTAACFVLRSPHRQPGSCAPGHSVACAAAPDSVERGWRSVFLSAVCTAYVGRTSRNNSIEAIWICIFGVLEH
jgi:hypothetical protein